MVDFFVVRLGRDSVADIRRLDALRAPPETPIDLTVSCAQVPTSLAQGDYVFIWFGSDNSKGTPTDWKQGLRAIAVVTSVEGGPAYNDNHNIGLSVSVVLPNSVDRKDLLAKASAAYYWMSDVPVAGLSSTSNQTVQQIKVAESTQDVRALLYALEAVHKGAKAQIGSAYPDLRGLFDYIPPSVSTEPQFHTNVADSKDLSDLVRDAKRDADLARLSVTHEQLLRFVSCLEAKRFLIVTGLAGSGKTKLAQAFGRWITPALAASDVFAPGSTIESDRVTYYVMDSDRLAVELWNDKDEARATKVTLPREMIQEWADHILAGSLPEDTPARKIREAVKPSSKFSDQLHSFETHLKASAFALLRSWEHPRPQDAFTLVPVGADWTANENILGYPNGLDERGYVSKPALDIILRARDLGDVPHFLVLDEMNLSHVERYFADILSAIESDEGLELYSGDPANESTWRKTADGRVVPPRLDMLPDNLFVVGTVNVDETTYMFSPKVLDRANVIEFRMEATDLEALLKDPIKPDLRRLYGRGAPFGKAFVNGARNAAAVPASVKGQYEAEMLLYFRTLQVHGAEFGFRTAYEAARFVHFYDLLGNHPEGDNWFKRAFDCVVFQKLLPKLHGSRTKLGPLLKKLWFLCVTDVAVRGADPLEGANTAASSTDKALEPSLRVPADAPYPLSAEKIGRMWRLLNENGFTSFSEA